MDKIKYLGTALVFVSYGLAATQYIPANFLVSAFSTLPWIYVAMKSKDNPLLLVNVVVCIASSIAFVGGLT